MSRDKDSFPKTPRVEDLLQQYPSLHRCVLIDARHASRTDIVKDLKASLLFETASEAKSLDDGLTLLQYDEVDACFLGPSVTLPNALKFLKRAKEVAKSKDIAFIVIVNSLDENAEKHQAILLEAGADGVVMRPCSKLVLADGVVRAVVKANGSGAWAALFLKSGHANISVPDPFAKKHAALFEPRGEATPPSATEPPPPPPPTVVDRTIEKALSSALLAGGKLHSIRLGIDDGEFRLDPTGIPTPRTLEEINRLIEEAVPEAGTDEELRGFSEFLNKALQQWVIDQVNFTAEIAGENLRGLLKTFKKTPAA